VGERNEFCKGEKKLGGDMEETNMRTVVIASLFYILLCLSSGLTSAQFPTEKLEISAPDVATVGEEVTITDEAKQYIARYLGIVKNGDYCFSDTTATSVQYWDANDVSHMGSTLDAVAMIVRFGGYSYEDKDARKGIIDAAKLQSENGGTALTDDDIVWIANHSDGDAKYCYSPGAATPTPTPTPSPTPTITPKPTAISVATPVITATPVPATPTPAPTSTPSPTPKPPGFEAAFAIAGLLAVAYLVLRRKP